MSLVFRSLAVALTTGVITIAACSDSTRVTSPSSPVILPDVHALSQTQTFFSDPSWGAQNVCLNPLAPVPCPAGATSYGYGGAGAGWGVSLAPIPGATWIWGIGVTGATTPAFPAAFSFSKTFNLAGAPISGSISIAADDKAQVFVNGTSVGTIGSTSDANLAAIASTTLTTFDISSLLVLGNNVIRVDGNNGNFGCGAGAYSCNPAGTVFGGTLVSQDVVPVSHGPLTPYPGQVFPGHIVLCKDASSQMRRFNSPYNFTITSSGTIAGDVVQATAAVAPGECRIIFSRTAFSNATVTLTITEFLFFDFAVHSITRTQLGGTAVFPGPSPVVTVQANSSHGALVIYKNGPAAPAG